MTQVRALVLTTALVVEAVSLGVVACSTSSSGSSVTPRDAGIGRDAATSHDAATSPDVASRLDAALPLDGLASACAESAEVQCGLYEQCDPPYLLSQYGTGSECVARFLANCEAKGGAVPSVYTATYVLGCTRGYENETCSNYLNTTLPDGCAPPHGPLANDASCWFGGQCEAGFCQTTVGQVCGNCRPSPEDGTYCATLTTCGNGRTCPDAGGCADFVTAPGGECNGAKHCGANLTCVAPLDAAAGTCQVAGTTTGVPCAPKGMIGPGCGDGFYCASPEYTCQPGASCAGNLCGALSSCQDTPDGGAHACVPRASDGEPCNTQFGPQCFGLSRCVGMLTDAGFAIGKCMSLSGLAATCH